MAFEKSKEVFEQIKKILDDLELKYMIVELKDQPEFLGVELNFDTKKSPVEIMLYISDKPSRINLFIGEVFSVKSDMKDEEFEIIKIINNLNTDRVLYGNLGYSDKLGNSERLGNIVYSNSISLAGRNTIEHEELYDYVLYSVFISEKVNEIIGEYLYEGTVK